MVILLVAIAYGAVAQGAFYPREVQYLMILAIIAAIVLVVRRRDVLAEAINPLSLTLLAFGTSAIVSGWVAGFPVGANGVLLVSVGLLCAALVARTANPRQQELLVAGVVMVAVLVALTGIGGAVMHDLRLATPAGGPNQQTQFFRSASTFTYSNSTAGFLLIPTLVAVARVATPGAGRAWRLAAFVLLLGLLATASRGGLLGLAVAATLLLVIGDRRAIIRQNWTVVLGVGIAAAGMLPSLPFHAQPLPLLAAAGILAGGAVALITSRRATLLTTAVIAAGGLAALVVLAVRFPDQLARFMGLRFNMEASVNDRKLMWDASVRLFLEHPVFGIGPGHFLLRLDAPGPPSYAYFSHNEYLQMLAEQGALGLGILVAGVGAAVLAGLRSSRRGGWLWTGLLAGLAGLAVHSGFDFLWHVTLIPLVAVVGLAILTSDGSTRSTYGGRV